MRAGERGRAAYDGFAATTAAGFVIEALVEHQPTPQMANHHPREYATLSHEPGFIAFRLAKAPGGPDTGA